MEEIWKDIEGYEGRYQISNQGRVMGRMGLMKFKTSKGLHYFRMSHDGYNRTFYCLERLLNEYFPDQYNKPGYVENAIDNEQWKDICDFEGLYQISNHGRVRNVTHTILQKNGRYRTIYSRIMTLHHGSNNDYKMIHLHKNNEIFTFLVHRLVASHFISPIPDNMVINHKDGNKCNNHVNNLEIVTQQENIDHSMTTGLFHFSGEEHYRAKITNAQAEEIRKRYQVGGISQSKLGKLYGLTQNSVFKIIHNLTYKNENIIN